MAQRKHFVLDHDVYLRLMRRKRETGLTASRIGNAILRTCLDGSASLFRLLRDTLVESGKLTGEEFDEAIAETIRSLHQTSDDWTTLLVEGEGGSTIVGSWEVRELGTCVGLDDCHIFEFVARDGRERPIPLHHHAQKNRVQVLAGSVLFVVDCRHVLLRVPESLVIPSGCIHMATPLTEDARFLSILVPS